MSPCDQSVEPNGNDMGWQTCTAQEVYSRHSFDLFEAFGEEDIYMLRHKRGDVKGEIKEGALGSDLEVVRDRAFLILRASDGIESGLACSLDSSLTDDGVGNVRARTNRST